MTDVIPPTGRLVIIRHGQTSWNASRRFQGQVDVALDDDGRRQARAIGSMLADRGLTPSSFVCSDLSRATETASLIGERLQLTARSDPRLRELDLGAWEGLDTESAASAYPDEYAQWRAGVDVRRGDGETYSEVADRAEACVAELGASGVALLVTHGGTAHALIGRLTGLPPERWWAIGPLGNCRVSLLSAASGAAAAVSGGERWRLAMHNGGDLGS